ncbi:hypothetical protein GJAV_G00182610 [Gymnothorax javanicus]|nr:hypothetical protein GJAV_G00182610 [Gymnothorax javanicus]
MRTTLICLWLLNSLVHMTSGCSLYAPKHVTGFTGGSVVLPCYCTDGGEIRKKSLRWVSFTDSPAIIIWTYQKVDRCYRDRVAISEDTGIFSLHLSGLTQKDAGWYRCEADKLLYRDISLTVKDPGCVLSDTGAKTITGFRGGSITLPCACTDVQSKPEQVKWTAGRGLLNTVIFPQYKDPLNSHYRNRVKLLNSISPGNLSLRIYDLTLADMGTYRCEADGQYREITLIVKDGE